MKTILIFLLSFFIANESHAHGGGESEGAKIGKGITAYDKHDGFKLSPEAQKRMQFSYKKVEVEGSIVVPKEALVSALNETHLYTRANEFFKAIDVKVGSKTKDTLTITSPSLKIGTEVIVKNVSFLRVIDMDLNSGEEEEHSEEPGEHTDEDKHHD